MLRAKEPVMSSRFLRDSTAWWMPKATSTRRPVRRMGRAARLPLASLPLTAATGLTPAARRAGAREESSTVSTPHHHAADDAHRADGEEGDFDKLRPSAEPQQGTESPGEQDAESHPQGHGGPAPVEGLPPDQVHDLGLAGADTAQHPVKLGALGGLAVQAARNHKDPPPPAPAQRGRQPPGTFPSHRNRC